VHGKRPDRGLRLPRRPMLVRQRRRGARRPAPGRRDLGRGRRLRRVKPDPGRVRQADEGAGRRLGGSDGPAHRLAVRGAQPDRAQHRAGDVRALPARVQAAVSFFSWSRFFLSVAFVAPLSLSSAACARSSCEGEQAPSFSFRPLNASEIKRNNNKKPRNLRLQGTSRSTGSSASEAPPC
jgi:hypothetical protein